MCKRVALFIFANFISVVWGQQAPAFEGLAYLNPALPIDQRVDDLLSRMTVEEKATQFSTTSAAIPRLQIPAYNWWSEALHGVANQGTATVFPQAIGLGATFDEPLILQMATVISTEARAKFHEYQRNQAAASSPGASLPGSGMGVRPGPVGLDFWSPNINIFRDPRWGRGQETYGEDPFLTGRLGTAFVRGMQGDSDLQVDVDVRNTGRLAGDEVVQIYLVFPNLPGAPLRALRGFQRVNIRPGETQHVRLALSPRDLSMVNADGTRLVAAGSYKLFVGGGQPRTGASGAELALAIQGEQRLPR